MPRRAIYAGSFDPPTNGHIDIIERACGLFDEVIVAVLLNPGKQPLFSAAERVALLGDLLTPRFPQVTVETFAGLLVNFARERNAHAVVRGIRAVTDYEYEWPMALMNRHLHPQLETVFLIAAAENAHISSRLVKEVFSLGGKIDGLVPDLVIERMKAKQ